LKSSRIKNFIFAFLLLHCIQPQAQFIDVTTQNGISATSNNPFHGSGCSFVDFNDDGWDDITFAAKNSLPKFYVNNGGSYSQIFPSFNPALSSNVDGKMPLWFDYDNDGDKDFLYTIAYVPIRLYRNDGDMDFTEVTMEAGIAQEILPRHMGAAAGDYDRDGFLDFFVCKYHNHTLNPEPLYYNILYHNNGDGTFTDVTLASGIELPCSTCFNVQASFMPAFIDYDRDGWQDIYVINDKVVYRNYLYHNNGDGTFENVTETSGAGVYLDAMSIGMEDYDNDDDIDIFITNTYNQNFLLNNLGDGTFEDVGVDTGVNLYDETTVAWGSLWLDYDNNTWQDLFIGTLGTGFSLEQQSHFYINNGDGTFSDGTQAAGLLGNVKAAYTSAMGDMNQDGYYDYINNNASPSFSQLRQNDGGTNNFYGVTVEGTISNRDGIGTWIEIWCEGNKYLRYTHCGENYMCQNSEKEIFGLAQYEVVDSLHLIWPSGIEQMFYNLPANTFTHYVEPLFSSIVVALSYNDLTLCPGDSTALDAGPASSYLWSTGDTLQTLVVQEAGLYFASIINQYGYTQSTDTVLVEIMQLPSVLEDSTAVSCFGLNDGSASIALSEGSIEEILWSNDSTSNSIAELWPGLFSYQLVTNEGCSLSGELEIDEPQPLEYGITITDALCYDDPTGTAEITGIGGTPPYQYDWQGQNPEALAAGIYNVAVTDSNDCFLFATYEIDEPQELSGTLVSTAQYEDGDLGTATLEMEGGTPPYSILWSSGTMDSMLITDLIAGLYSVEVVDANGCLWDDTVQVDFIIGTTENTGSPIIIYPNPASHHFTISGISSIARTHVLLEDVWGRQVIEQSAIDGNEVQLDVEQLHEGVYHLLIMDQQLIVWRGRVVIIHD